jgi:hypothetical protein
MRAFVSDKEAIAQSSFRVMSIQKQQLLPLLVAVLLFSTLPVRAQENQTAQDCEREKKTRETLRLVATIKARPECVWSSVHDARTKYPGLASAKMISEDERGSVFEQTFVVPFIGDTSCTFSLCDIPPSRMDYKLIESNIFSAIDGSWLLAPGLDGHSTSVELSCYVTAKRVLPKFLLKLILGRKLGKQLDFVKTTAEKKELEMQATEKKL